MLSVFSHSTSAPESVRDGGQSVHDELHRQCGEEKAENAADHVCARLTEAAGEKIGREKAGEARRHDREEHSDDDRSEEHTSELQSLMRISSAVFCLKKTKQSAQSKYSPKTFSLCIRSTAN